MWVGKMYGHPGEIHLSLKGWDQNNWEHTCGWQPKKNGHPPLICICCEAMRRQKESHAWTMFGQFVLLQGCILPHSALTLNAFVQQSRWGWCMWKCRWWKPIFSGRADKSLHSHDPPFGHLSTFPRPFMPQGQSHHHHCHLRGLTFTFSIFPLRCTDLVHTTTYLKWIKDEKRNIIH